MKNVKKEWVDLQSQTRKREAERRREAVKTGGGPEPLPLKSWEEKILAVTSDGVISGLETGYESEVSDVIAPARQSSSAAPVTPISKVSGSSGSQQTASSPLPGRVNSIAANSPSGRRKSNSNKRASSKTREEFVLDEYSTGDPPGDLFASDRGVLRERRARQPLYRPITHLSLDSCYDYSVSLLEIEKEKLDLKKQRIEIERRKADALEGILVEMKKSGNS